MIYAGDATANRAIQFSPSNNTLFRLVYFFYEFLYGLSSDPKKCILYFSHWRSSIPVAAHHLFGPCSVRYRNLLQCNKFRLSTCFCHARNAETRLKCSCVNVVAKTAIKKRTALIFRAGKRVWQFYAFFLWTAREEFIECALQTCKTRSVQTIDMPESRKQTVAISVQPLASGPDTRASR